MVRRSSLLPLSVAHTDYINRFFEEVATLDHCQLEIKDSLRKNDRESAERFLTMADEAIITLIGVLEEFRDAI